MSTNNNTATITETTPSAEKIENWCIEYICKALDLPVDDVDPEAEFHSFGLDSAAGAAMLVELEDWLLIDVPPSEIFEQVTIAKLASALEARLESAGGSQ